VLVSVSLFGDVSRHLHGRDRDHRQELPDGATVRELMAALGIDPGGEPPLTIAVNGELGRLDSPLRDGDKVMLVTPMEGG
jgi:molybdopterin converting factor small subunit